MTVARKSMRPGLTVALAGLTASALQAQGEKRECQSASSRLRRGQLSSADVQVLSACAISGPPALAEAWRRPAVRNQEQSLALTEATASLRDDRLFVLAVEFAGSGGNDQQDRLRALQVLARYYDMRFAPSIEFLTAAGVGSPIPRRFDEHSVDGASPLRTTARNEIGQVLARLSTSDGDPVVQGAARRLRQSIAISDPPNTPLASTAIRLVAGCGSLVELQSTADIGVQVELQVNGPTVFRQDYWIAEGTAAKPAKRLLSLPPGPVIVSFGRRELAKLVERKGTCPPGVIH